MPTTTEEKPAKTRARNRKAADQRTSKAQAKARKLPDQVALDAAAVDEMTAPAEQAAADIAPIEAVADPIVPEPVVSEQIASEQVISEQVLPDHVTVSDSAPAAAAMEEVREETGEEKPEAVLSGEVLPPEMHRPAAQPAGLSGIALAYGEYSRKSWATGRFLVERLITVRSFDEVIEIQSEFARQVVENFLVQSERICTLYGEWSLGFFRPFETLATGWPRAGR